MQTTHFLIKLEEQIRIYEYLGTKLKTYNPICGDNPTIRHPSYSQDTSSFDESLRQKSNIISLKLRDFDLKIDENLSKAPIKIS